MAPHTFLAPGQRYADIASNPWRIDQQLTILHIVNHGGSTIVTYRLFNGDEESTSARQFESAIANGLIVPVIGPGRVAAC
jgi:hypothetical protein